MVGRSQIYVTTTTTSESMLRQVREYNLILNTLLFYRTLANCRDMHAFAHVQELHAKDLGKSHGQQDTNNKSKTPVC